MQKIHFTRGKTLLALGSLELDSQDLGILLGMVSLTLLLSLVVGSYAILGLIVAASIFRNILIAKGQIKKQT